MRSPTTSTTPRCGSPAASSSGCASPARSPPNPEVLLLDEPCSALDPQSTKVIEDLIVKLRDEVAVVIVTHNLQQAYRIADYVAFMYLGELVEYGSAHRRSSPRRASSEQGSTSVVRSARPYRGLCRHASVAAPDGLRDHAAGGGSAPAEQRAPARQPGPRAGSRARIPR